MDDEAAQAGRARRQRARGWNRAKSLLVLIAVVCWGLDQATKALAVRYLDPTDPPRLFDGLLTLQLVRNPGAAFSLGVNHTAVFTILSAVVFVVIWVVFLPRVAHAGWGAALGFVSAGILGNLTDRMLRPPAPLRGHVVDFLQLPHWAIFNVADMCVCTAAVMIVILAVIKNVPLSGRDTVMAQAARGTDVDETGPGETRTADPAHGTPRRG